MEESIKKVLNVCFKEDGNIKSSRHSNELVMKNLGIWDEFDSLTSHIHIPTIEGKLKWLYVGMPSLQQCLNGCGQETSWRSRERRFNDFCGKGCANKHKANDPQFISNLKESMKKIDNVEKQRKRRETTFKKHGVDHILKRPDNEVRTNHFKELGLDYTQLSDHSFLKIICSDCGSYRELSEKHFNKMGVDCIRKHFETIDFEPPYVKTDSFQHKQIMEFLDSLGVPYTKNDRTVISPKELDIYIASKNLAIEINGLYFHRYPRKHRRYHLDKHTACVEQGVRLIQFWDVEINNNLDIVKSIISQSLGMSNRIYARECSVVELSIEETKIFLDSSHIQGKTNSSVKVSLKHGNELVSIMTFMRTPDGWELNRFSNKTGTSVVGGAQKMFSYFIKTYSPSKIITFSDIRMFDGKVFEKLGFKFSHTTQPQYWYFTNKAYNNLLHRRNFQKQYLAKMWDDYDPALGEWENMQKHGYMKVYDCGKVTWIWKTP